MHEAGPQDRQSQDSQVGPSHCCIRLGRRIYCRQPISWMPAHGHLPGGNRQCCSRQRQERMCSEDPFRWPTAERSMCSLSRLLLRSQNDLSLHPQQSRKGCSQGNIPGLSATNRPGPRFPSACPAPHPAAANVNGTSFNAESAERDDGALPGYGNIKVCRSRRPSRPRRQERFAVDGNLFGRRERRERQRRISGVRQHQDLDVLGVLGVLGVESCAPWPCRSGISYQPCAASSTYLARTAP